MGREEKGARSKLRPPELTNKPKWPALVMGSRGGDLERPLRVAFLGATLPGAFLVPFWASKKEHPFP